ncbi:zinc finger protein zpr1, putative [Entamoeba dispar SAW760]|uniref:Zinc finger protein zpr1, putative n=1 Tax=Entamoeba dispar (strain ATCC PRA-260 / SAW760) TaxID=370354 RepID=B0E7Y7_ENTDS|nr:zinc finger protein zpr1, putative [Entamoeba dispar SAW760]EDR29377.1 zinc finger protein zpr1, putative [Entamoeba dispar SAW760]|eukprot:EDR29377.1 zinc finger protein zpr1, putative [Entamoeba dispar SAW760]
MATEQQKQPEIITLSADKSQVTEVQSLCVNCYKQGTTRLMLTEIPYFRDILLAHFQCPYCHYENTEVEQTSPIQDHGMKFTLKVENIKDLSRQIVKSDHCSINFPSIGFEIPSTAQSSSLNTLEGFIENSIEAMNSILVQLIPTGDDYKKINSIVESLNKMKKVEEPYIVEIDDPSGNSFVQNLCVPKEDPQINTVVYIRNFEQNKAIGLIAENQTEITPADIDYDDKTSRQLVPEHKNTAATRTGLPDAIDQSTIPSSNNDIAELDEMCQSCGHMAKVRMLITQIPYFKEVTIMAFSCDTCGYRSNEVKCGGPVSPKAKKLIFKPKDVDDLSRSFLKSDTASVEIPEIGIELQPGTLGSKFTTVEGFIKDLADNFENMPFLHGDSAEKDQEDKVDALIDNLKKMRKMELPFTLIVDDPMANSYIQDPYYPEKDPCCEEFDYERTNEQNDDLGLNDMVVD